MERKISEFEQSDEIFKLLKQDSKISDEIKGHKNKIQIKTQKSETKKKPINIFADDELIWGLKLREITRLSK